MGPLGSTYRLQLNGVGFSGAARLTPYLAAMGVEALYVSPITRARAGSGHGYDVVDPTQLDPALGTREDFDGLLAALGEHGMQLVIDIVPNHMAATPENRYFADVLRHGRRSRYAACFDIAWADAGNAIVLPVLDEPLPAVLDAGGVRVARVDGSADYEIRYGGLRLPVDPGDDAQLLVELATSRDLRSPDTRRLLELVLAHQHYRLVPWRQAARSVNYRRFFDINDLIGIRQEDARVFAATHDFVLDLATDPRAAALRIDHVDGLRDPAEYLASLHSATPAALLVEKILEHTEPLPGWPVDGTTGYEFAAAATGLFVEPRGAERLVARGAAATGDSRTFEQRAVEAKRAALDTLFVAAFDHVGRRFGRVPRLSGVAPDHLAPALAELTVHLEVYRTYRQPGRPAAVEDLARLDAAAKAAASVLGEQAGTVLDGVVAVLRGDLPADSPEWEAVAAWQQLTPAVTAKGVEDTALYAPGTLLAVADVGFDPDSPARSPAEFHAFLGDRRARTPGSLNALSTHDSKRSHDVRCRLAVLSELADEWEAAVAEIEDALPSVREDHPDVTDRRFGYETIVGVWPVSGEPDEAFAGRIDRYLVKAAREAKRRTNWIDPDAAYEQALRKLAADLLESKSTGRRVIERVVRDIEYAAATNSLASVVLRAAAPGVSDVYQGDEGWFLALVDPDNRAPLDLASRQSTLDALPSGDATDDRSGAVSEMLRDWRDGRIKQYVVRETLRLRRGNPALFAEGDYRPLAVHGAHADRVIAFARTLGDDAVVCIVPRLVQSIAGRGRFPLGAMWGDTSVDLAELSVTTWTDALTGKRLAGDGVDVARVLTRLPAAVAVAGRG